MSRHFLSLSRIHRDGKRYVVHQMMTATMEPEAAAPVLVFPAETALNIRPSLGIRAESDIICLALPAQKVSSETWEQIGTGFAAGISLREIACEMDIPAGALLSRGKNAKAGREASEGGRKTTKDDQRVSFRPNESRDRHRATLISVTFYVPAFSFDEQRAPIP